MATTLITGGTVVSATGRSAADVLIDGETIVAVLQPNRVGREDNEYGDDAVDFYGTSQVIDPRGNFVGERGSSEHEELLVRDLDLDLEQAMRDDWQFYRDRRPDSYGGIVAP